VGEYDGPRSVYIIPVSGGEARRLTHHPGDLGGTNLLRAREMVGWTPDGKQILFSSRRTAFAGGKYSVQQLFTVPAEGGFATPLPLVRAAHGCFSPDGARMAYVPNVQTQLEWKRYRGGQTTPIWIANLADSNIEGRIPRDNSNDFNPLWGGRYDLFSLRSQWSGHPLLLRLELREVRQVVSNDGFDIKSASASSDAVVYEQFGSLHLLDLKAGTDRVLDIRPAADFPEVRPRFENVADMAKGGPPLGPPLWKIEPKISPTGARAVFGVRGEVLTCPPKKAISAI